MRLKSLRVKGFKSFANDTVINFDDNLIGIVGPNGSGKSNIVDAVRWVLGEQKSRELRLNKMSDVIFNGTKSRKAASIAQVTLEFDNTKNLLPIDYNSVSISRLLFRNGDSEYRLNNVSCRKKDITDLFLNSGIGSNSYAIIALGMVDDILQNKDHSRRKMFEQAAGISKFKIRKKETESKLRSTEADLDRLEDILYELEANMKSLEKQAKRAEKFIELKDKYKRKTLKYSKLQIGNLQDKFKEAQSKITELEDQYTVKNTEFHKSEADLEKFKKDNVEMELAVSSKQKELNALFEEVRQLESQKDLNQEKVILNKSNLEQLQKSTKTRTERHDELTAKHKQQTENCATNLHRFKAIEEEFKQIEKVYLEVKDLFEAKKSEINKSAKRILALEENRNELEKTLAIEQNKISNAQQSLDYNKSQKAEFEKSCSSIEVELQKLESEENKATTEEADISEKISTIKEKLLKKDADIEQLRNHIQSIKLKAENLTSQRDLLKSMIDSMEGFPESIKFLKKQNKNLEMIADIIDCEDQYKQSVEQYFEAYLNHFVVDSMSGSLEALQTLKNAQKGKASFYVLEELKNVGDYIRTDLPSDWVQMYSILKVKKKYESLAKHLSSNVYIVPDDSELANVDPSLTLISKNGSIIKSGAEVRGGSIGLFEGKKLGRKKTLEKVIEELAKLESEVERESEKLAKLRSEDLKTELEQLEGQQREAVRRTNQISQEKAKLETEYKLKKDRLDSVTESITKLEESLAIANKEVDRLANEILNIKRQLEDTESNPSSDGEVMETLELELAKASNDYNTAQIELIKQEGNYNAALTELEFIESQLNENKLSLDEDIANLYISKDVIKEAEQKILAIQSDLELKYHDKAEKEKLLNSEESKYFSIKNEIGEKENNIRQLNRQLQQLQTDINNRKDKYHGMKLELNSISERLNIEFDLSLEELEGVEVDSEKDNVKELKEVVDKLRRKISNYGEVNPMAVVTFNEIKERYDEMIIQRDDVLSAKASLLETISEIQTEATDKFKAAFDKIAVNFSEVFRSLFSEDDDADLVLLNPDDPLESDIEIIAKPKGKRPKSLSQLSGGEKTLTATALLFSLYLLKPAPFCIFDEVDAPLDDANILKFSRLIKKFSDESQFILITHNKSTMAAVNLLYGVFMQEQGVSAIAPVDFRSYEYNPVLQVVNN